MTQAVVAGEHISKQGRRGLAVRIVGPLAECIECQADVLRVQRRPDLGITSQVTCQTSHRAFAPAAVEVLGEGVQE